MQVARGIQDAAKARSSPVSATASRNDEFAGHPAPLVAPAAPGSLGINQASDLNQILEERDACGVRFVDMPITLHHWSDERAISRGRAVAQMDHECALSGCVGGIHCQPAE